VKDLNRKLYLYAYLFCVSNFLFEGTINYVLLYVKSKCEVGVTIMAVGTDISSATPV